MSSSIKNKQNNEDRLAMFRLKIHDQNYMNDAIQRIAGVLSKNIVDLPNNNNKEFKYGA